MHLKDFLFLKERDIKFIKSITTVFGKAKQKSIENEYADILLDATKDQADYEHISAIRNANIWLRDNYKAKSIRLASRKSISLKLSELYRPDIKKSLLRQFDKEPTLEKAENYIAAFNRKHSSFSFFNFDDKDICSLARESAEQVYSFKRATKDTKTTNELMHHLAAKFGIEQATGATDDIIFKKYEDQLFWRPRLRRIIRRKREELAVACGIVKLGMSKHSSRYGQSERHQQLDRNKKWAEQTIVTNGTDSFLMAELLASKEKCHQAEIMTMLKGLTDIQDKNGWHAAMLTITCPGEFRRNGTTPKESADHLRDLGAKARAKIKRKNLDVRGMQVFQPHHNGIAHQHIFCVGDREEIQEFAEIYREYALKLYPHEKGANTRRFDLREEDRSIGRLSSYAARYVVRLAMTESDKKKNRGNATETYGSEDTWYAAHSIRRISWFGLPPKNIWRLFRTITRDQCKVTFERHIETTKQQRKAFNATTKQMLKIRRCARNGEYANFVAALEWTGIRSELDCSIIKGTGKQNKYGETTEEAAGLFFKSIFIFFDTATKWVFEKATKIIKNKKRTVIHNCPSAAAGGIKQAFADMLKQSKHVEHVPIPT